MNHFVLNPYCPQLGVLAKGNGDLIVMWVYNRENKNDHPITGALTVPDLSPGTYTVNWLDTRTGQIIKTQSAIASPDSTLALTTPPIASDAACWIRRAVP
jgi:hypothetical protein